MAGFDEVRRRVVERVLVGDGVASTAARRAAFDNRETDTRVAHLVDVVASGAWAVSDEDVAGPLRAGMSDDEVFETVVCAALGQAQRQLDAALAAVAEAVGSEGGIGGQS